VAAAAGDRHAIGFSRPALAAAVTFTGLLLASVLSAVPQQTIFQYLSLGPDAFRHFQNFRLATQVLFSTWPRW
jgi:hypothetical protein